MESIKNDFINDYIVLLLSESAMCEKYNICRATFYKTKTILGLKRIKTTKVNRILGNTSETDVKPVKKVIKTLKDNPNPVIDNPDIKPVFHSQVDDVNVEIIQKPANKPVDKSALLQALQLSTNTLNKVNKKKVVKK
jgi:hypothetical protein